MSRSPEEFYTTDDFDYELLPDRIARYPAERRDESRLLVLDRATGAIQHRTFRDIITYIKPGDALVINETRVFPARLIGKRTGGGEAEVLLLRPYAPPPNRPSAHEVPKPKHPFATDELWEALVRPGNKLKAGRTVHVAEDCTIEIVDATPDGGRVVRLRSPLPVREAIERYGQVPLPPYMQREAEESDRERYQTVYGTVEGSVAAPTAGLHFTAALLNELEKRDIRLVRLLLHVGVGTFRPVEVADPGQHVMHAEHYQVSPDAARQLNECRQRAGSIWAVGTTVTRTLESVADERGTLHAGSGWTSLFIRPGYRFKAVDRLITNFHLPRSTLLMLVAAFGGYEKVMHAYRVAIEEGYRFYSYGDAMLIL